MEVAENKIHLKERKLQAANEKWGKEKTENEKLIKELKIEAAKVEVAEKKMHLEERKLQAANEKWGKEKSKLEEGKKSRRENARMLSDFVSSRENHNGESVHEQFFSVIFDSIFDRPLIINFYLKPIKLGKNSGICVPYLRSSCLLISLQGRQGSHVTPQRYNAG